MPYFGNRSLDLKPYYCPVHKAWFRPLVGPDGEVYNCTVIHSGGSCCHYKEEMVSPPRQRAPA